MDSYDPKKEPNNQLQALKSFGKVVAWESPTTCKLNFIAYVVKTSQALWWCGIQKNQINLHWHHISVNMWTYHIYSCGTNGIFDNFLCDLDKTFPHNKVT